MSFMEEFKNIKNQETNTNSKTNIVVPENAFAFDGKRYVQTNPSKGADKYRKLNESLIAKDALSTAKAISPANRTMGVEPATMKKAK